MRCWLAIALLLGMSTTAFAQADPMLDGDPVDGGGVLLQLQPDVPDIQPGADGELGTGDDIVHSGIVGDFDLVVRTGITSFSGAIPGTAPTRGAVPLATSGGTEIPFVVAVSNGANPPGNPAVSPGLEGNPVLVVAYADLDGDGYIGVTNLDGVTTDFLTEEAELDPVGRRFAIMQNGQAGGSVAIHVAAPASRPLRLLLAAGAFTGPTSPGFFGGAVPTGPMVLTNLPFFPRLDPDDIIEGGLPNPADPNARIDVEVEDEFTPNPSGLHGETFTLLTDGSELSVDVAEARSGSLSHFALMRIANPATYDEDTSGPLRPGVNSGGGRVLLELLRTPVGAGSALLVATDTFGNVIAPATPQSVELVAPAGTQITSPNSDGNTSRESVVVSSAAGVPVTLAGAGDMVIEFVPEAGAAPMAGGLLAALAWVARRRRT